MKKSAVRYAVMFLFCLGLGGNAFAKVLFFPDKPVSVKTDIKNWSTNIKLTAQKELVTFKSDADGYTECRDTKELKGVVLCGSYVQRNMNAFLTRASLYSEGGIASGYDKGVLVKNNDKHLAIVQDIIDGHDIHSKELLEFYDKMAQRCLANKQYCLTPSEEDFYRGVIKPLRKRNQPFVIITFSVQTVGLPNQVVSHEFAHAKFFLDPIYKSKIDLFWQTRMSAAERKAVAAVLKEVGYSDQDEQVVENEFQAYILMDNADEDHLSAFVAKYRKPLQDLVG